MKGNVLKRESETISNKNKHKVISCWKKVTYNLTRPPRKGGGEYSVMEYVDARKREGKRNGKHFDHLGLKQGIFCIGYNFGVKWGKDFGPK